MSATTPVGAAAPPALPADVPDALLERAAEWFATLRSGAATDADRAAWKAWLDEADAHRAVWSYVERISGRFMPIQTSADPRAALLAYRAARGGHRKRRRRVVLGAALAVGSGGLGWLVSRDPSLPAALMAWRADHRTRTGEIRELVLDDGSQVWLDTASAFDQHYDGGMRRLRLIAGRIVVRTAADPTRPFVVDTAHGRLRAIGTRFAVGTLPDATALSVFEGAVEARAARTGRSTIVAAGQRIRLDVDAPSAHEPADASQASWTRGVLIAQNQPLASLAETIQRYRGGIIDVAPEVARWPVFGSFPAGDPDRALAMLESALPIRVRRRWSWWLRIEAREPAGSSSTISSAS